MSRLNGRYGALSQSQRIFQNVCDQLDRLGTLTPPDTHRELLMAGLADGMRRHIDEVETSTFATISQEIWQRMAAYVARYDGSRSFERKKDRIVRLYRRFTDHVSALVAEGHVDPRTAKVFLNALPSLTRIGAYEAIVRNHERVPLEYLRAKNEHYVRVVETMWAKQPEDARRQSNGFYCFNPQPGRRVKSR